METLAIQIIKRETPARKTKLAYDVVVNGEVKFTRHSNREYNFGEVLQCKSGLKNRSEEPLRWYLSSMRKHLNQFDKYAVPHMIFPVISYN